VRPRTARATIELVRGPRGGGGEAIMAVSTRVRRTLSDGRAAASLAHEHSNLIDSESRRPNLRSGRARAAENGSQHDRVRGWDLSGLWT
jgi:hypothetical protein